MTASLTSSLQMLHVSSGGSVSSSSSVTAATLRFGPSEAAALLRISNIYILINNKLTSQLCVQLHFQTDPS